LDNPLHVILNNSKLASRIYVILIANKELIIKKNIHLIMLQDGMSLFRIPVKSLHFFKGPNPFSLTMTLGLTQPITYKRASMPYKAMSLHGLLKKYFYLNLGYIVDE
jgi:hypothetical protein